MKLLKYIKEKNNRTLTVLTSVLFLFLLASNHSQSIDKDVFIASLDTESQTNLWEIQSIDTMKTSRDRARAEFNNPEFDNQIDKELSIIKSLGANYVAIGTPYDEEFLPYLNRWVTLARKHNLRVWFKGNFSNWEGWFGYPMNMSPEEHHRKTAAFIETHPELFNDGDIFDPCPECENAGFWKQPEYNREYNEFMKKQQNVVTDSFNKIDKNVRTNLFSIIGGRAREVLTKDTANELGNVITIDHYINDPSSMREYIHYFSKDMDSKTLVGEFGAPIPDINGPMNEDQQANFVEAILEILYINRNNVEGINYWVNYDGTTALLNLDYTQRKAADVVKKYFRPAIITGTIHNSIEEKIDQVTIETSNKHQSVKTDTDGTYKLFLPAGTYTLNIYKEGYKDRHMQVSVEMGKNYTNIITLEPEQKGFLYMLKEMLY